MTKFFPKCDAATDGESTGDGSGGANENTGTGGTQTANADIQPDGVLANSNTITEPEKVEAESSDEAWQKDPRKGDLRYYQTGIKRGMMKPSAQVSGVDSERKTSPLDLDLGTLKATATAASAQKQATETAKAKTTKAERKLIEAKIGAKMAMRLLDTIVGYISKGQYGRDFTPQQAKERNAYREALEKDWEDYLLTLDVPMHPALVVAFGSITYTAAAFNTEAGQVRAASWKEKLGAKIGGWIFSRGK